MKISFIATQSEFGGAQRYIAEMARRLDPRQYEVIIAAGEGDGSLMSNVRCQNSKPNVKCQRLKYLKRIPGPATVLLSIIEIYKFVKKEGPDVLFLCSTTAGIIGSISGILYKKLHKSGSKLQILYRIGGWAFRDPRPGWQNQIILLLEKITARFKDKIIVNCELDRQLALKYKIAPEEKIIKIYNGIDVNGLEFLPRDQALSYLNSKFKTYNGKPQLKTKNFIIGTIANFYKTKGLKYLIEAIRILNSRFLIHNFKVVIIGDGRLRAELEALIKKYRLEEKVFLLGRLQDGYRYLKALDIFVLPSLKEGFPWVILEAMAAEVPIVATKVGALPEIIEQNREGLLVEPKNSRKLAEKINWLLSHPERARQMVFLSLKKAETQFSFQKMLQQTEKLLIEPIK